MLTSPGSPTNFSRKSKPRFVSFFARFPYICWVLQKVYVLCRVVFALSPRFPSPPLQIPDVVLNGDEKSRHPGNLNLSFAYVEGESLLMALKDIAVSSGSACTSASLEPSYVLRALGRDDELAHSSIRFSFGRFTTEADIDHAIKQINLSIGRLRDMSPLWDMYKEGIDLSKVEWVAH